MDGAGMNVASSPSAGDEASMNAKYKCKFYNVILLLWQENKILPVY